MNSSISNSSALTQSTKQAIHQQDFRSVYIPPDIWRKIAEFSSADTVENLRQVSKDIRSALDGWPTVEPNDAYVRVPEDQGEHHA